MSLYRELRAILDGSDKRRTHWRWVMPRDQWEMFRVTRQGEESPTPGAMMIEPCAAWAHGRMLGHPVELDETVEHVELRPA